MAKKSKSEVLAFYSTEDGLRKIKTVRTGILNRSIQTFEEVFATIARSNIQAVLGKEYYAFLKAIEDPGRFSLNEVEILATFLKMDYDEMHRFVRNAIPRRKKK